MADPSRVEEVFFAALEKPAGEERNASLAQACGGDEELRRQVERLLAGHDQSTGLLEHPPVELQATIDRPNGDQPADGQSGTTDDLVGTRVGPYKLLEQIGEGGMGVVYMADQQTPIRRRVALKIIKPGLDTRQVIARFEAERQALALMDHPNIARVFDAGTIDAGRPYFVMELVRGVPITEYCDLNNLPVHERLELFEQVCLAVQHAHQKGIIHRDIKPSNVLVTLNDARAVPKVIDFGVAKAINQQLTEKTLFTNFAQMVGTPLYMSPEQAEMTSLDVDTRTDIYSLGVLLYELLTGTTPVDRGRLREAAYDEIRRIIREEVPPRPSTRISTLGQKRTAVAARRQADPNRLSQLVRGDLDWIAMRALEKDRSRRYETATGLAADIRRYLLDEPVEAGPPSALYRFRKLARRNQAAITTAAILLIAMILGTAVSSWQAIRAIQAERRSDEQATKAQASAADALSEKQRADAKADEAEARAMEAAAERERAEQRTQEANAATLSEREQKERNSRMLYAADMNLAQQAWDDGHPDRALALLEEHEPKPGEADLRGWEWYYQKRLCSSELRTLRGHTSAVKAVAISSDGNMIASGCSNGSVKIWNAATGRRLRTLVVERPPNQGYEIQCVAFSPDGGKVASLTQNGRITLSEAETGCEICTIGAGQSVADVSFSPDGKSIASASDKEVTLWDIASGDLIRVLGGNPERFEKVTFSRDGLRIAAVSSNNSVKRWDVASGEQIGSMKGPNGYFEVVAFAPDGKELAFSGNDGTVVLWELNGGRAVHTLHGHTDRVTCVVYSASGRYIASTSWDNTVRLWDADSGDHLRTFKGHSNWANCAAFSPNGQFLVSASQDETIKIWDPETDQEKTNIEYADGSCDAFAVDLSPAQLLCTFVFDSGSFSVDGRRIALAESGGPVKIFNVITGQLLQSFGGYDAGPENPGNMRYMNNYALFSPNGRWLASHGDNGTINLWDAETGRGLRTLTGNGGRLGSMSFSPDGRRLASCSDNGTIKLWDAETGTTLRTINAHEFGVEDVSFSFDGRQLASGHIDGTIRLFDSETGAVNKEFLGHDEIVNALAYQPQGPHLASASNDQTIRLWNPADGSLVRVLRGHASSVDDIAFSPDGRRLASVSSLDKTMKLWDVESGREVRTIQNKYSCDHVRFSPEGRRLIVAGGAGAFILDAEWRSDDEGIARSEVNRLMRKLLHRDDVLAEIDRRTSWNQGLRDAASEYARSWNDDAPALMILLGEAAYDKHDWPSVVQILQESLQLPYVLFDFRLNAKLGDALAMSGDWRAAAELYGGTKNTKKRRPSDVILRQAMLQLAIGNDEGYRRICGRLMWQHGESSDIVDLRNLAVAVILGERALPEPEKIVRIAQRAVDASPGNLIFRTILGAALFRADQTRDAIATLTNALHLYQPALMFSPDHRDSINASRLLGKVFLARCYYREGDSPALERQVVSLRRTLEQLQASPLQYDSGLPPWTIPWSILISERELAKLSAPVAESK